MAQETVAFELVSPERLLMSADVAMVVVPGGDGHFGVLPRHAPLISTLKPGVIDVYETRAAVTERIFVAGGFAEVTGETCTVLAEHAVPVSELDVETVDREISALSEDLADTEDQAAQAHLTRALDIAKAKRTALSH